MERHHRVGGPVGEPAGDPASRLTGQPRRAGGHLGLDGPPQPQQRLPQVHGQRLDAGALVPFEPLHQRPRVEQPVDPGGRGQQVRRQPPLDQGGGDSGGARDGGGSGDPHRLDPEVMPRPADVLVVLG
ncbi:hypothetical protein [Nonomuraea harbinensis]|uniref:Uncharacterized protein n=1 Tax=Nonomuraea harbinensis TaxID=1286938 RepID=A0ABW1C486_9ACTN|nr:hypothetical protein [Nonomuraea harbinensis]